MMVQIEFLKVQALPHECFSTDFSETYVIGRGLCTFLLDQPGSLEVLVNILKFLDDRG